MQNNATSALRRWLVFSVERLLVRGAHYRFLVVVALIGLISIAGAAAVLASGSSSDPFRAEVWWAFLRLSDPGYLGDDEGLWRRVVSTVLTVLGYVVFMGAMVAILTQWLNETLRKLEMGLTPIRMNDHIAILGWTSATRSICRNLVLSEGSVDRWLKLTGISHLRIAILAPEVGAEREQELRDTLGGHYSRGQIVLRSGSPLRASHLARVDFVNAACLLIPAVEGGSNAEDYDAVVLKTLRLLSSQGHDPADLPACVCEILDHRRVPLARRAYAGSVEVVASDVLIGRLLAASIREPGLSQVASELLTHGVGATLYVRKWTGETMPFDDARRCLPGAIAVGIVRSTDGERTELLPDPGATVQRDDDLVVIGESYAATEPADKPRPVVKAAAGTFESPMRPDNRILILGWSRRVPDIIADLCREDATPRTITVVSLVPVETRRNVLKEHELIRDHAPLEHVQADATLPLTLRDVCPSDYDCIVIVASDWLATGEESDARSVAIYVTLEEVLSTATTRPHLLVELLSDANSDLVAGPDTEVVVTPFIRSNAMAQIALRRELRRVFDEFFGPSDIDVVFEHLRTREPCTFDAAAQAARQAGAIAIGVRHGGPGAAMTLAATPEMQVDGAAGDEIVLVRATRTVPGQVARA